MRKSRRSCIALSVCSQILKDLNTEVSLEIRKLAGLCGPADFGKLFEYKLDPSSYTDWKAFAQDYAAVNLLSKWKHFDAGVDKSMVAIDKFLQSEDACRETNKRLGQFNRTVFSLTDRLPWYINTARGKIERLLPTFCWDEAWRYMGFGPGASLELPKLKGDSWFKYGLESPTTTGENARLAAAAIATVPQWLATVCPEGSNIFDCLKIVGGNRVTTVPKSAKTDRVIAIEPLMNMYVQKGIGGWVRKLLKKVQVNLDSQKRNQELACKGSLDGSLATIDLASASDSIAMSLVELLLPDDWVTAIKLCRSPIGVLPSGEEIRYQKVSSMGNGFTFELESLIFWALSSAVTETIEGFGRDIAIYGDDIIVPTGCVEELVRLLEYVGFKTNADKSFWTGPFRESCGKHYFLGHDVTPIYVKDRVGSTERMLWLGNSISRLAHRFTGGLGRDAVLLASYESVRARLPKWFQTPRIPENFGDGALVGDFDEVTPRRLPHGVDGYQVEYLCRCFSKRKLRGAAMLVKYIDVHARRSTTLTVPDIDVRLSEIPRRRYKLLLVKGQVQQWVGHGPWW